MRSTLNRALVFALYQTSLLLGIALLPMALLMRQFGVTLPIHRAVDRFGDAYEQLDANAA